MKLEYDFAPHSGSIILDGDDNKLSDGEIVILFRGIDPQVKSIQIKFGNSNQLGGSLMHSWERGWIVWRGSGPNPTKRVNLPFGKPRSIEQLLEFADDPNG